MQQKTQKHGKGTVACIALGIVAAAGIVAAIALAPGIGAALRMIDRNPKKAAYKLNRALGRLVDSGNLSKGAGGYRLSKKGNRTLARLRFDAYEMPPSKGRDKKWRVICFDIPEKKRFARALIHYKLKELGFYRLQDSLFVTTEPCGEFLSLAQEAFGLKSELCGMVATEVQDDRLLRKHFGVYI